MLFLDTACGVYVSSYQLTVCAFVHLFLEQLTKLLQLVVITLQAATENTFIHVVSAVIVAAALMYNV